MILLVIVVQTEDVDKLSTQLVKDGFRLTRINAKGGFLAAGSAVLLLGVEEEQLPAITAIIKANCSTRVQVVNAWPSPATGGAATIGIVAPVEVLVGGAIVFAIPIQHFARLGGLAFTPLETEPSARDAAEEQHSMPMPDAGERTTDVSTESESTDGSAESGEALQAAVAGGKLVVAIVQRENSDTVVDALRVAGHRLTRLDTAGGFLRRGNATLLIGVEASRLNDVLGLIHANCKPRTEATPIEEGMPMYGATVFVLETSNFLRF